MSLTWLYCLGSFYSIDIHLLVKIFQSYSWNGEGRQRWEKGTAPLCNIWYYSWFVAFCRGGSAEPAGGPEDQRYHHHSWPEHRSDVQHPRGAAAPHHLETQRRHPQLPRLGGYQRKS